MKKLLITLSILAAFCFLLYTALLIYVENKADQDTKVKSDVILVLGGVVTSGTSCYGPICNQPGFVMRPHYNPCVISRIDQAVWLYKNQFAPKILMSGGNDKEDNVNEAETMKKIAIEEGVPESDILTETQSTSTYENISFSQKIMQANNLHSVIIVSEPYHMARAGLVASKLQMNYSLSPAINSTCWNKNDFLANWNFAKKEPLAIIGYKLLNQI